MDKIGSVPAEGSDPMYEITFVQFGHFGVLLVRGVATTLIVVIINILTICRI